MAFLQSREPIPEVSLKFICKPGDHSLSHGGQRDIERSSVLHGYEMSTSLKKKITVVLGAGLLPPSQFYQDVAVAMELLLSSETVEWVGTGASTEVGNVQ